MGTPYYFPTPFSKMGEFAILNALRKTYRIIEKGVLPEPKGITVITETPVAEKDQKALGLVPIEDL